MFSRLLSVGVVVGVLLSASAVRAEDQDPKEMFEDATRMMLQALELMIKSIPQYEAPVVLDNGDILIRRKQPEQPDALPQEPDQDRT